MNWISKFVILILQISEIGCFGSWTTFGNHELMWISTVKNKTQAARICAAYGGRLVEPVTPSLKESVISAVLTVATGDLFWTGLVRNHSQDTNWIGNLYKFEETSLNWRAGHDATSPGDCLAMHVNQLGIYYYPEDCSITLEYICQKLETFLTFEENTEEMETSPLYSDYIYFIMQETCERYCLVDNRCIGYRFIDPECWLLNATSFSNLPPALPTQTCDVIEFTNCTLNGTDSYGNCSSGNETTLSHCSNPTTATPTNFTYYLRSKSTCVGLESPEYGDIGQIGTQDYFSCTWPYIPREVNITCEDDGRWNSVPYCSLSDDIEKCPAGWEEFGGLCYFVKTDVGKTWFEASAECDLYDAVPLHIDSEEEMEFIDKLLYYHTADKFWTSGTNRYVDDMNQFVWSHRYELITYTRWDTAPAPSGSACIFLESNGTHYNYKISNACQQLYKVVCQKGRIFIGDKDCGSSSWCKGGGLCANSKSCYCPLHSMNQVGLGSNSSTYCTKKIIYENGNVYWTPELSQTWEMAVATCKNFGGSIFTPVDQEMEDFTLSNALSGSVNTYWTGFLNDNSTIRFVGDSKYDVTDTSGIPFRESMSTSTNVKQCVHMRVWQLGVRFYFGDCAWELSFICTKPQSSPMVSADKSGDSFKTMYGVLFVVDCELECLYDDNCVSYEYSESVHGCRLFPNVFSGNPVGSAIQKTRQGCGSAVAPRNGDIQSTLVIANRVVRFTYSCQSMYQIPAGRTEVVKCQNNGRWDQLPYCIPVTPPCPIEFEYHETACYHVTRSWLGREDQNNAISKCNQMDAYLLYVESLEEMIYLTTLLSFAPDDDFWTSGNDNLINGFYTWSISQYQELSYQDWYNSPSSSEDFNCVALSRSFNDTTQDRVYYTDKGCARELNYVCKKKTLNIGYTGCNVYGTFSCKVHSQCEDNKCQCGFYYRQIGIDDSPTTFCEHIKYVGNGGCLGYDFLCINGAKCTNGYCKCPAGTTQNGPDGFPTTTCENGTRVLCPTSWTYYNNRCYSLFTGFVNNFCDNPIIRCGELDAYLAVITDSGVNLFVNRLGPSRSRRYIGLTENKYDNLEWSDGSAVNYQNFMELDTYNASMESADCVFQNEPGYWQKANCYDSLIANFVCERPTQCPEWPVVENADYPSVDTDLGASYTYTCNRGFALWQNHSGFVECFFDGENSVWTTPPVCAALTDEIFTDLPTIYDTYASIIQAGIVAETLLNCTADCYDSTDCTAISYNGITYDCTLISDIAFSSGSGLPPLTITADTELWEKKKACSEIFIVEGATYKLTGKLAGDTLTYTCGINYYMHRGSAPVLTCLSSGQWDYPPPVCIARFKRSREYFYNEEPDDLLSKVQAVRSVDDCERRCLIETTERCMMSMFFFGHCFLYTKRIETRDQHIYDSKFDPNKAVISELKDSNLQLFDATFQHSVPGVPTMLLGDLSRESCAIECLSQTSFNCKRFMIGRNSDNCSLFDADTPTLQADTAPSDLEVFQLKTTGCSSIVSPANMQFTDVIKQVSSVHSIGDVIKADCLVFGEEITNNHSSEIECLSTETWSHVPVCKNLCESGWFMMNGSCYKMMDTPKSFWESYLECHALNAGLVNVEDATELNLLQTLWNNTGQLYGDVWLGLYSDLGSWHWSERLGGDILNSFPNLEHPGFELAVAMDTTDLSLSAFHIHHNMGFICKKWAGKLVCPTGWLKFRNKCFKVVDTLATFDEAETYCQANYNGNLASLHSFVDLDVVGELIGNTVAALSYVGLKREAFKDFKWTDGSKADYEYHKTSDCCTFGEVCGVVEMPATDDITFELTGCITQRPYVCQLYLDDVGTPDDFSQLPCSTDDFCANPDFHCVGYRIEFEEFKPRCYHRGCPAPFTYYEGGCFYYATDKARTYVAGQTLCHELGGHTVTMDSLLEEHYVMDVMRASELDFSYQHFFLGIDRMLTQGPVSAGTRREPLFTFQSINSICYSMDTWTLIGAWKAMNCYSPAFTVCERNLDFQINDPMYEGCFHQYDDSNSADWQDSVKVDSSMTIDGCIYHCGSLGFKYAEATNGDTCGCSNNRGHYYHTHTSDCNLQCTGNASQICGGFSDYSVYRVTGNPCSSTMVRSAIDPGMCYSITERLLNHTAATLDCILQGGYLAMLENPTVEEKIYNQLVIGLSRTSESNQTWMSLYGSNYWNDGDERVDANWFLFDSAQSNQIHSQVDTSKNGSWVSEPNTDQAFYICQLQDKSPVVRGFDIQRQFNGTMATQISRDGRTLPVYTEFDFGCLNNRQNCPDGFMLMFWLLIGNNTMSRVIFTTGDCASFQVKSDGFCVFYENETNTVNAIDVKGSSVLKTSLSITKQNWSHLLFFFKDSSTIHTYIDGDYFGHFGSSNITSLVRIVQTKHRLPESMSEPNDIRNITFIPSAPDEFFLHGFKRADMELSDWTTFPYNEKERARPELSPGIDGSGLQFPFHGFNYFLEEYLLDNSFDLSVGFWFNVPLNASGRLVLLTIGEPSDDYASLEIYYDGRTDLLNVHVKDMYSVELAADLSINKGNWEHLAVTLSRNVLNVYLNGFLSTTGSSTVYDMINDPVTATIHLGNVICPVGWVKHEMSCYTMLTVTQVDGLSGTYWQYQEQCESYGGYLTVIDNERESLLAEKLMDDTGKTTIYLGVYDRVGSDSERTWLNLNGAKMEYQFFTDTEVWNMLYVVMEKFNPNNSTSYNIRSGSTSTNDTNDINGICEINQRDQKNRKMKGLHCPAGWYYFDKSCYKVGNVIHSASEAQEQCAKERSQLVEIDSIDEQEFLSGYVRQVSTTSIFYIGAWVMRDGNPTDYVWSDLRPVEFSYWSGSPVVSPDKDCAVMNCDTKSCHWQNTSCSDPYDYICEKPSELDCVPGWRAFKDKCVSVYQGTQVDLRCAQAGANSAMFDNSVDLEEFLYNVDLGGLHCLTSGLGDGLGTYMWKSPSGYVKTYFSGETIPGSGLCVGINSAGLQLGDCPTFTCVICEYSQTNSIAIDNIHILPTASEADILHFYQDEQYTNLRYEWPMDEGDFLHGIMGTRSDGVPVNLTSFNDTGWLMETQKRGKTLAFQGALSGLTYTLFASDTCLSDIANCPRGISVEFMLYAYNISDCYILDTQTDGSTGILIWTNSQNSRLSVLVYGMNYFWEDWIPVVSREWIHIAVTWHPNIGLKTYVNFWPVHSRLKRVQREDVVPESTTSSYLVVGRCSSNHTETNMMIDDLHIRTSMTEEWEYAVKRRNIIKEDFILDFNEPDTNSNTNVAFQSNGSYVQYIWRNSLFHTAARIDNMDNLTAAIKVEQQLMNCFTRTDVCGEPFTVSLWLRPRDMESDQTFLYTGTKSTMDVEIISFKIWYNSYTNFYIMELYFDKAKYQFEFFIYLYEWSHLVVMGDFHNSQATFHLNGQKINTLTTTFEPKRLRPLYPISFMKIGTVGRFDIDDIKIEYGIIEPKAMYVLESCNEYTLAGFIGVQNLTIDTDRMDGAAIETVNTCNLQTGYSGYYFSMDSNSSSDSLHTTNTTIRLSQYLHSPIDFDYVDGISMEAVSLNQTGLIIAGLESPCFGKIPNCFFGFTFAMWVKIEDVTEACDDVILQEMGGDVHQNESGISIICFKAQTTDVGKVDCVAAVVNSTEMWTIDFSLLQGSWTHLALTWNPYKTLQVYLNGHSTSEFGVDSRNDSVSNITNYIPSEPEIRLGHSSSQHGCQGHIVVDEVYVKDMDMADKEIKALFGTRHVCSAKWKYNKNTDLCYLFGISQPLTHVDGEAECQKYGGNLAVIPDTVVYDWITQTLTDESIATSLFINMKQLPREGFPLSWPDGSKPDFLTSYISTSGLSSSTRYCGIMKLDSGTWNWAPISCGTSTGFICQAAPLYVKSPTKYINSTALNMTQEYQITGNLSSLRGLTSSSLVYDNTELSKTYADSCLVNFDYCHNGMTIQFWMLADRFTSDANTTILSTKEYGHSYGISVYLYNDTTELCLGVNIRTDENQTNWIVPITAHAWTHVSLSVSNLTVLTVYLNGISVTYQTISFNSTDTAHRSLGDAVDFKTQFKYSDTLSSKILIDNFTVPEVYMADPEQLFSDVYLNAPVFRLPLDDDLLLTSGVSTMSWLGNALHFNASNSGPASFLGQFSYDCLGSPDFCKEGFTMLIWIKPENPFQQTAVISALNSKRGFTITYHPLRAGIADNFWMIVRNDVEEKQFPFQLEFGVWSQFIFTWYGNGTVQARINGLEIDFNGVITSGLSSQTVQPVVDLVFNPCVDQDLSTVAYFEGGVDEFVFYRRPVNEQETLELYKNSTFLRNPSYWSFDDIPDEFEGNITALEAPGINGSAAHINSGMSWLLLTSDFVQYNCIIDIDKCVHGFTLHFYFRFIEDRDSDQIILTTGADNSEGIGMALMYTAKNKSLPFRRYFEAAVLTSNMEFRTWFNLEKYMWNHVIISWHRIMGIKVLVDGILASINETGATRSTPVVTNQEFCIGQKPTAGYDKGQFEIDELHFLDRVMFEDSLDQDFGGIWQQQDHQAYISTVMSATEVLRSECHQVCRNITPCGSFSFCSNQRFGHCEFTNTSSQASVINMDQCDVFTPVTYEVQVLAVGCVNISNLGYLANQGVIGTTNQDCFQQCKNLSYVYSVIQNHVCLCAMDDSLAFFDIWISGDVNSGVCDTNQLEVFKISGHRDFLNVTVPISEFFVDASPGIFLLVNQTLILTMNATKDSYAGYGIDNGNGSVMYFTGHGDTSFKYNVTGVYNLMVYALNEISSMLYSTDITVMTSIEGAYISHTELVGTHQNTTAVVTVSGGTSVTCNFSNGESHEDSAYQFNSTEPFIFYFVFQTSGTHLPSVVCYNPISEERNTSSIEVLNSIFNFTFRVQEDVVVYGNHISLQWSVDSGSNVTYYIYLNESLYYTKFSIEPDDNYSLDIPVTSYNSVGEHLINITAVNVVSGPYNDSKFVQTDREIVLTTDTYTDSVAYRIGEVVKFSVSLSAGSNVDLSLFFGDGDDRYDTFTGNLFNMTLTYNHWFLNIGEYNTSCIVRNSVSQQILNTTLLIDFPVDNFTLTISDPVNFLETAIFSINVSDINAIPISSFANITFGDSMSIERLTLDFIDGIASIYHNYSTDGYYNVTLDLYNDVSSLQLTEVIQVGQNIWNLDAIADRFYIKAGTEMSVSVDVGAGSGINYTIDFGDGDVVYHNYVNYPDASFAVNHVYQYTGHFSILITAANIFNEITFNLTVEVHEEISGIIYVADTLGRLGHSMKFFLKMLNFGTESCFVFNFGDGTETVIGESTCADDPQYSGKNFTLAKSKTFISMTHTYYDEGTFRMTFNGSNAISSYFQAVNVKVLMFPCDIPKVELNGFSKNASFPTTVYSANKIFIRAIADTYCLPVRNVLFEWTLTSIGHDHSNATDLYMPPLPYLVIPANFLKFGQYQINVTIFIEGYSEFNDTSMAFVNAAPSSLVLKLQGDEQFSIRDNKDLVLNGSASYDPDFKTYLTPFNFTWYCWRGTVQFSYDIHKNSPLLIPIKSVDCYENLPLENINYTELTIPQSYMDIGSTYTFVAVMSHEERLEARSQRVLVQTKDALELHIQCVQNCHNIISPNLPVKVKGICDTCDVMDRLSIPYHWKLFLLDGPNKLSISLDQWTTTGINGPNLAIKEGLILPGSAYELRLESGNAYTAKRLTGNLPPYDGHCTSNLHIGMAFETKFEFICDGWLDEGDRTQRDKSVDSMYLENFNFIFHYQVKGQSEALVPFFELFGHDIRLPNVMLRHGLEAYGYAVKIVIHIEDRYGGFATSNITLQVIQNTEVPLSLLTGPEMTTCQAERDMMCVLLLSRGFVDMANDQTFSSSDAAKVMDTVVNDLIDFSDFIQDPVQLKASSFVTDEISQSSPEVMSMETKEQFSTLLTTLVGKSESYIRTEMTFLQRQETATKLLRALVNFSQRTKYDPHCVNNSCTDRLEMGRRVVNLLPITHNLTALILDGTIPGEEPVTIRLTEGNAKFCVENRDVLTIINTTIDFEGQSLFYLPDLSSIFDPRVTESVYFEIMLADNLHTVDSSVQAVKARATSINFVQNDGTIVSIQNLQEPLIVNFYPPQLNDNTYQTIDLSPRNNQDMFYIEIHLNESGITPNILMRPYSTQARIEYYLRLNQVPSNSSYDEKRELTTWNETVPELLVINVAALAGNQTAEFLYIGFKANYNTSVISPLVNISFLALGCLYWEEQENRWAQDYLYVDMPSDLSTVSCLTTHMTTFGINIFVPPNTIDFTTVWSKFSADNLAVMCTVGVIFGLYFAVLVFIRRADSKDHKKWLILPLADNTSNDRYHYCMTVYTGIRSGAGTTSTVYFVLGGEEDETEIRHLQDTAKRPLASGSVNNYLLSVPNPLGSLQFLRIWLDSSEDGVKSDWLLNKVIIRDVQTDKRYIFLSDQWFALDKDDGQIERLLYVASEEEIQTFGHLFFAQTRKDLTDGHLWISVFSRPIHSNFTRVQRLSCCLSLLFLTMITNAMWYRSGDESGQIYQNIYIGPFTLSAQELTASLLGSIIVVPCSLIIITLFRKARPKEKKSGVNDEKIKQLLGNLNEKEKKYLSEKSFSRSATLSSVDFTLGVSEKRCYPKEAHGGNGRKFSHATGIVDANQTTKTKDGFSLPHWCIYIAWILVAISVVTAAFFTILYSMEWGSTKSSKWLTSFILSFVESVILLQPLKVITVAIVMALIFKTVDNDEEEIVRETFKPECRRSIHYTMATYPAHRIPYKHNPPDTEVIDQAREYRKKMNKLFFVVCEVIVHLLYLTVIIILTYNNRDLDSFRLSENLKNSFLRVATKYNKSLVNVSSAEAFWDWTVDTLVPGLYSSGFYNGNTSEDMDMTFFLADNANYKVGQARFRQARIEKNYHNCIVPSPLNNIIWSCLPEYSVRFFDNNNHLPGWNSNASSSNMSTQPWLYQDSLSLNGLPVVGRYGSYGGGGYIAVLGDTRHEAFTMIKDLRDNSWIDRFTRAVLVEFNVFNPNVNLFGIVTLLVEFPATGGAFQWPKVAPLALYKYSGASALVVLIFDLIFVAFTIYFIVDFIKRLKAEGKQMLSGFWNFLDLLNIILSLSACAFYGVHFVFSTFTLDDFRKNKERYVNFQHIVLWDEVFGYILAFLMFLSMLKLLKMIRFNSKITQFAGTLRKSFGPIANFFIVFSLTLVAFAAFGYLVFGSMDKQYSSFVTTMETLMSMLLMKIDINDMLQVNGVLGSIYLFLFVLFIVFVLINMLLSIINDSFSQVRKDPDYLPDDPEVVTFMLEQFKRLVFGYIPKKQEKPQRVSFKKDMDSKVMRIERRMTMLLGSLSREKI